MAEVRDLTPLLDEAGEVVGFPTVRAAAHRLPGQPAAGAVARGGRAGRWSTTGSSSTPGRRSRCRCRSWPPSPATVAPLTVGAGLDQIMLLARLQGSRASEPRDVALRFSNRPGHRRAAAGDRPADRADARRWTTTPRRCSARGPAARSTRTSWRRCWPGRAASFVEHDLDERRPAGAGRPAGRAEHGRHRRRPGDHADGALPGGHDPGGAVRRPDQGAGHRRRAGVRPGRSPRSTSPRSAASRSSGSRCPPAPRISMDSGTENMDWVARALRRIIDVHPGRRGDQRRRRRDQRRRPAVLERRGDDAHAHQGHPGHDAGQRDGAHRQALAGLLGRGVGRGQLRHRRLRPGHGPERAGAVLGAEPAGRRRAAARRTTSTPTSRRGSAGRGRPTPSDPRDRDVRVVPARAPVERLHHRRRHLLGRPPTRSARSRSTSARSCGRSPTRTTRCSSGGPAWPTPTRPSSTTRTSAATR